MRRLRCFLWIIFVWAGVGALCFWWEKPRVPAHTSAFISAESISSPSGSPPPAIPSGRVPLLSPASGAGAPELAPLTYGGNWQGEQPPALAAFRDWVERYVRADPVARDASLAEGVALARARRPEMKALINRDPGAALAATVPAAVRDVLPAAVGAELETRFSVLGDFQVLAVDYRPAEMVRRRQQGLEVAPFQTFVKSDDRTFRVQVYGRRASQTTEQGIPLHGIQLDDTAALHESALRALEPGELLSATAAPLDVGAAAGSPAARLAEVGGRVYRFASAEQLLAAEAQLETAEAETGPRPARSIEAILLGTNAPDEPLRAAAPIRPWTAGEKKILIIRIDFPDLPGDPKSGGTLYTAPYVQGIMDGEVAPYFLRSSYGKTSLTSTVTTQVYRMPHTGQYYIDYNDPPMLMADARTAAAANYTLASYDRILVLFSPLNFSWAGLALVGGPEAWINGEFDFRIVAHELGHTYGVKHANLWHVRDGNPVSFGGVSEEYGDDFDTMGNNGSNDHRTDFNPWFKNMLGWIADDRVQTVSSSGTYRVYRFDHAAASVSGLLALKIPRDSTRTFWVAARRNFTDNAIAQHGAYVIWGYPNNSYQSNLLEIGNPGGAYRQAPLLVGGTLNDPAGNLSIRLVGEGGVSPAEYIDVEVVVGLGAAPVISAPPQSRAFIPGETVVLSVTASGNPTPQYQWLKNGTPIAGATTSTLTLFNAQAGDAASYTVRVSNSGGSVLSAAAELTFNTAVAITRQPGPVAVAAGGSATFSVTASGSPAPGYQWRRNGTNLPGATSSSYTIANVQAVHAGGYDVIISNSAGSVLSDLATLTVGTFVNITGPSVASRALDQSLSIAFATDGPADSFNFSGVPSGLVGNRASGVLSGTPGSAGTFIISVSANNAYGAGPVSTFTLNVGRRPAISSAATAWGTVGSPFAYDLSATDSPSSFAAVDALPPGLTFDPANGQLRGTPNVAGTTTVRFTATNAYGAGDNFSVGITVAPLILPPPAVASISPSQTVDEGGTASLAVAASGSGPFTYQWRKKGKDIAGATSAALTLAHVGRDDLAPYSVKITGPGGEVTSPDIKVTVNYSRLTNVSVRALARSSEETLIVGFGIAGEGSFSKQTLIRGIGPTLGVFPGIDHPVNDTAITLFRGLVNPVQVGNNDDWEGAPALIAANDRLKAFAPASVYSKDAILLAPVSAIGSETHSVHLGAKSGGGTALVEIYDADTELTTARINNVSARTGVGVGADILVVGFYINGPVPKKVLIRGVGPRLGLFGVAGVLADPKLELFRGNDRIAANDDWASTPEFEAAMDSVGAFSLERNSKDAALLVTLPPGSYSAQLSGAGGTTGVGLIEVYDVP